MMQYKAIVIGASSGIGRELTLLLARENYQVGIAARRLDLLRELQSCSPNITHRQQLDVVDALDAQSKLSTLISAMQGVDLVVLCAGVGHINPDLDYAIEDQTIATNVSGFMALANVAIKHFIQKRSGHLVGLSSIAAIRGGGEAPAYNASKAFVSNYLQGLRQNVKHAGLPITVTDIKPGFVNTAMAKGEGIFWVASVQEAARQIYAAIRRKKSHAYITKRWRLVAWLLKILPDSVYHRLR